MSSDPNKPDPTQFVLDTKRMWEEIAQGLHAWALVEEELFELFCLAISPCPKNISAAVFHASVTFDSKRKMTDSAIRTLLSGDPLLDEWIKPTGNGGLCERLRKKSMKRNTLAHGMVMETAEKGKPGTRKMVVCPPFSHANIEHLDYSSKQMDLTQLKDTVRSFWDMMERMRTFRRACEASPRTRP